MAMYTRDGKGKDDGGDGAGVACSLDSHERRVLIAQF